MKITIKIVGTYIEKTPPFNEVPVDTSHEVDVQVGMGLRFQRAEVKAQAMGKVHALHEDTTRPAIQIITEEGLEWVAVDQVLEVFDATGYQDALMAHTQSLSHQQKAAEEIGKGNYTNV